MTAFLNHLKANGKKIDAEIEAVFKKYNIKIVGRSARVDASEGYYKFKIQFDTVQGVEVRNAQAENTFRRFAVSSGLNPDWFGKKFRMGNRVFTITGFNPRKHKKPVELEANGKNFCASAEQVRWAIAGAL